MRRLLALALVLVAAGCSTRPTWEDDPAAAELDYWMDRPAAVWVEGDDYRALWDGAVAAGRRFGFTPVISDYRNGELVYDRQVSGTLLEPWRDEQRSPSAWAEATLNSVSRHIRIDLFRDGDGWRVEPRVVIRRYSGRDGPYRRSADEENVRYGTYANGRDLPLERSLADRIAKEADARKVTADPAVLALLER